MLGLLQNILAEILIFIVITIYFLLSNKTELLKKLGYKKTQMDIPYDYEQNLVLIAEARNTFGKGIFILPQTSKTDLGWDHASMINASDLGMTRNLYNPKRFLGFIEKSDQSKKTYSCCLVKCFKNTVEEAIDDGSLKWQRTKKDGEYAFNFVDYESARFVSPNQALEILKECTKMGRVNSKRAFVYEQVFAKLVELYPQNHSSTNKL